MPSEAGKLSQAAITSALVASNLFPKDSTAVFNALGKYRPKASAREEFSRGLILKTSQEYHRDYTHEEPVPIVQSEKAESVSLEIEPLILGAILSTQSWKSSFLQRYYALGDQAEFQARFPTDLDVDKAIDQIQENVGDYKFYSFISHHIRERLDRTNEDLKKHEEGRLTVGLEIEVDQGLTFSGDDQQERVKQSKRIDALQEIGIPITYDGMREIPLPYSRSAHEQLFAVQSLGEAELINGSVRMHLNVGGIERFSSDILLLHQMAVASGLFEDNIKLNDDFHPLEGDNSIWAKHMIEGDYGSPRGMPIRLRENGVIEFRWLIGPTRNFSKTAKGIETFVKACEALSAWQKVFDQDIVTSSTVTTQKDLDLAKVWIKIKSSALATFESFGIPAKNVDKLYDDADDYVRHETQIRSHVITSKYLDPEHVKQNADNRKRMYAIFLDGRAKVKEILKK